MEKLLPGGAADRSEHAKHAGPPAAKTIKFGCQFKFK
jgi:hypothetical protein